MDKEPQLVAGYIRCSVLEYPDHCTGETARAAFLADMIASRRAELIQMAAGHGQQIHSWYEDLGRSGRGQFLASRTGFEALTLAAREQRLTDVFAWDLSRLFRDLVQQELWLGEMESLGVAVHIQDLPFAIDIPARRLLRQELGMINEYQAARTGALLSASLNRRVEKGLWVGRSDSQWGLRYDALTKGFLLDEATAPYMRRLYETFNEAGGSASHTARILNKELRECHPQAISPPHSRRWDVTKILLHIRDPLYRRRTVYNGGEYAVPHLIPEVVSPEVLAATDALLESRRALYEECMRRHEAPPEPYLYAKILRCAECGGGMQAYPLQGILGPSPGLRVPWVCSDTLHGGECSARFKIPQYRLTALLDRGLRQAFERAWQQSADAGSHRGGVSGIEPASEKEPPEVAQRWREAITVSRQERRRLTHRIYNVEIARQRCLDAFAIGLSTDRDQVSERLAVLEKRRAVVEEALRALELAKGQTSFEQRWALSAAGRLQVRFESVWPADWWLPRDEKKAAFLKDLNLKVLVRIHPAQKADHKANQKPNNGKEPSVLIIGPTEDVTLPGRGRGKGPYKPRLQGGLCEIELSSPIFQAGWLSPDMPIQFANDQAFDRDVTSNVVSNPSNQSVNQLVKPLRVQETQQELLDYKMALRPIKS